MDVNRRPTSLGVKAWAADGMRWVLIASLVAQGVAGWALDGNAAAGLLLLAPGLIATVSRLGLLLGALGEIVFVFGFPGDHSWAVITAQLFFSVALAWVYSLKRNVD